MLLIACVDVATFWTPKVVVYGWQFGTLSHLLEIPGTPDQSARRGFGCMIVCREEGWIRQKCIQVTGSLTICFQ